MQIVAYAVAVDIANANAHVDITCEGPKRLVTADSVKEHYSLMN